MLKSILACTIGCDGLAHATVGISGQVDDSALAALKDRVLKSGPIRAKDYEAKATFDEGKSELQISVQFNPDLSNDAQIAILGAFQKALEPLVKIDCIDFTGYKH